jgi:phosphoribosyl 1,2-cyclic phosphate phosphodiesterase
MEPLKGLDILLLDCLRYQPHFTHIHLEQSLAYASLIKARETYFIHMTHEIEYGILTQQLPQNVHVAYDGLRLDME